MVEMERVLFQRQRNVVEKPFRFSEAKSQLRLKIRNRDFPARPEFVEGSKWKTHRIALKGHNKIA